MSNAVWDQWIAEENWSALLAWCEENSGPEAIAGALVVLQRGAFGDRWLAVKLLPRWGEGALQALCDLWPRVTDLESRWFILRALGGFREPEAIALLVQVWQESDHPDEIAAIGESLVQQGEAAIAFLTQDLEDDAWRSLAVRVLSQIRTPNTLEPLLQIWRLGNIDQRAIALEALGSFHHPQVLAALTTGLQEPAAAIRRVAVAGYGYQPGADPEALQPLLGDLHLDICQQAAIALGRLAPDRLEEMLLPLLQTPTTPEPLQETAIQVWLWKGGDPQPLLHQWGHWSLAVSRYFLDQLSHGDLHSRQSIRATDPPLVPLLCQSYEQHPQRDQSDLKCALAHLLGHWGDPQGKPLLEHLQKASDRRVQIYAQAALRQLDPTQDDTMGGDRSAY